MSQKFTLYNDLQVGENLDFIAFPPQTRSGRVPEAPRELSSSFRLTGPLETLVQDLPGGIKQQISLAAASCTTPRSSFWMNRRPASRPLRGAGSGA